jgi:hypothetical protein
LRAQSFSSCQAVENGDNLVPFPDGGLSVNKIAALIVVLIGSCFIAEKGSVWFGNTFIYTQNMRDSNALTARSNKTLLEITYGKN